MIGDGYRCGGAIQTLFDVLPVYLMHGLKYDRKHIMTYDINKIIRNVMGKVRSQFSG